MIESSSEIGARVLWLSRTLSIVTNSAWKRDREILCQKRIFTAVGRRGVRLAVAETRRLGPRSRGRAEVKVAEPQHLV